MASRGLTRAPRSGREERAPPSTRQGTSARRPFRHERRIAVELHERALIAVLLGGDAGLRTGEMIALEWTDLDFRRSLLHMNRSEWEGHIGTPKGGRARTINMTSRLSAALKAHRHLKGLRVLYSDDKSTADRD